MDNHKVLVYGATGYTGKLICLRLKELNINFAIAGRNKAKIAELSSQLNVPNFVFETSDFGAWQEALRGGVCINQCGWTLCSYCRECNACLPAFKTKFIIWILAPNCQLTNSLNLWINKRRKLGS